jgi:hypothetical protein
MRRRELLLVVGMIVAGHEVRAQQSAMPVIGFPRQYLARPVCTVCRRVPSRTERSRLCRGPKRSDRISLGRGSL